MTEFLQGFMNPAPVKTSNQGRSPWPKRPRRVAARTRPGLEQRTRAKLGHITQRMTGFNLGQHKSAALTACKAARTSCKGRTVPAARIFENPGTASAPGMYYVAALGCFSSQRVPKTGIKPTQNAESTHQIAGSCKPASLRIEIRLQGQTAGTSCKEVVAT